MSFPRRNGEECGDRARSPQPKSAPDVRGDAEELRAIRPVGMPLQAETRHSTSFPKFLEPVCCETGRFSLKRSHVLHENVIAPLVAFIRPFTFSARRARAENR
jgi:hypothetical protein